MDCLFCRIIRGEIPCNKIYEDEDLLAFHDISPAAPAHVLIIPKKHIDRISALTPEDEKLMGRLMGIVPHLIEKLGLEGKGVRLVNNCGEEAGQSVFHLHFHLMGGRPFSWPPG